MQTFNWHLELSSKCSLKCPRCSRTERPDKFVVTELDLSFIKKLFTESTLAQTKRIILCGGQGDPIYCKDFLKIIEYFKQNNPEINLQIVTNGSYKTNNWWKELAKLLNKNDDIVFSVDGWDQESNDKYRVNNNFESIIEGIKELSANKEVNIIWSTIIFKFNEDHLEKIKNVAADAGATHFQLVRSMMFGTQWPVYLDENGIDPLEPLNVEKNISNMHFSDRSLVLPLVKKEDRKNTIKDLVLEEYKKLKTDQADIIPACKIGERSLYVDAEGILYPCSWISHPFGTRKHKDKVLHWNDSMFVKHKDNFNLYNFNLFDILNNRYYNKLENSFVDKDKHFIECLNKCPKKDVLKRIEGMH